MLVVSDLGCLHLLAQLLLPRCDFVPAVEHFQLERASFMSHSVRVPAADPKSPRCLKRC